MRRATCLGLLVAMAAAAGCAEESGGAAVRAPVAVEVVVAARRTFDRAIDAAGVVETAEVVWISSAITGVVQAGDFADGQRLDFADGHAPILFRLDTRILNIEEYGAVR